MLLQKPNFTIRKIPTKDSQLDIAIFWVDKKLLDGIYTVYCLGIPPVILNYA